MNFQINAQNRFSEGDLSKEMGKLWTEQVFLLRQLLVLFADQRQKSQLTQQALIHNARRLAELGDKCYGKNTTSLKNLLQVHFAIRAAYILAAMNRDREAGGVLEGHWYHNAGRIVQQLSALNPYYDRQDLKDMWEQQIRKTKQDLTLLAKANDPAGRSSFQYMEREILRIINSFNPF